MKRRELNRLDAELSAFLDGLSQCLKRSDQRRSFEWYVTGLLLDGERKSLQPTAARLVDSVGEADAMRQRLQKVVSSAPWDDTDDRSQPYRVLAGGLRELTRMMLGVAKRGKARQSGPLIRRVGRAMKHP